MSSVPTVVYDHVQFYVKELQSVEHYKTLEKACTSFCGDANLSGVGADQQGIWEKASSSKVTEYSSQNQDLVEQLIIGIQWRIVASHEGPETRTVLVASPDPKGARFLISAPLSKAGKAKRAKGTETFNHFDNANLERYFSAHSRRQGVGVLGFRAAPGQLEHVLKRYRAKHPALVVHKEGMFSYKNDKGDSFKVVEVYAYYSTKNPKEADNGTVLRFVEGEGSWGQSAFLPGLEAVEAKYPLPVEACAYFDHWVSNVVDRKQFLSTLEDTLGFVPKVDFNAGVVAAGEAIIESTVTGNTPSVVITNIEESLVNQEQVYLPINNALSPVGHVAGYIEEIGQGIQHLASRVKDLVGFIGRANFLREATGQGFNFLNIPQSYYGRLTVKHLQDKAGLTAPNADKVMAGLVAAKVVSVTGIVSQTFTAAEVSAALPAFKKDLAKIVKAVKFGIYSNIYSLMGDNLHEETYLSIVRNKVLVDIQGDDILYQIFTAPVLQGKPSDEAPFLEFIQRVCSDKKDSDGQCVPIRPGCGGFGIRNFLTLFLSIEVSKAMMDETRAIESGDKAAISIATRKVKAFSDQLDESNPVLTTISDAMTEEGDMRLAAAKCTDANKKKELEAKAEAAAAKKKGGNETLQAISDRYKAILGGLRKESEASK